MARRRKGRDIHGVLLLDKPVGWSSNQAVQKVRWLFQARKAGHTGTLDPFATGMLPICLGEASKTAAFMLDAGKTYEASARLGEATSTGDIEGEVIRRAAVDIPGTERIEQVMAQFTGVIEQVPPMYSALKHRGRPLYELAREGKEVERAPRPVTIHRLELLDWEAPDLRFRVRCSKGTYVRTLAEDIAGRLGSCAHLKALRRLEVEPFREDGMVSLEDLENAVENGKADSFLLPVDSGLSGWPVVKLDEARAELERSGDVAARISDPLINPLASVAESAQFYMVQGAEAMDDKDYAAAVAAYARKVWGDEPEVIVLDLMMPGIDGIEVMKQVKQTRPEVEVIILTGHGSEEDRETCMNLGAFAIVAFLRNAMNSEQIDDYSGLVHRSPGAVVCLSAILFSKRRYFDC